MHSVSNSIKRRLSRIPSESFGIGSLHLKPYDILLKDLEVQSSLGRENGLKACRAMWRQTSTVIWEIDKTGQDITPLLDIKHSNILKVFGSVISDKPTHPMLLLEYAPGGNLFNYIHRREEAIPKQQFFNFVYDAFQAVQYLHRCNIVHKHIRSKNFLVFPQGLKVCNYSMLKSERNSINVENESWRWSSPEMLRNPLEVTTQSDTYSLLIVVWEMLTDKLPFEEEDERSKWKIINEDLRPSIPNDLKGSIVKIFKNGWQKDPIKRPNIDVTEQSLCLYALENGFSYHRFNQSFDMLTCKCREELQDSMSVLNVVVISSNVVAIHMIVSNSTYKVQIFTINKGLLKVVDSISNGDSSKISVFRICAKKQKILAIGGKLDLDDIIMTTINTDGEHEDERILKSHFPWYKCQSVACDNQGKIYILVLQSHHTWQCWKYDETKPCCLIFTHRGLSVAPKILIQNNMIWCTLASNVGIYDLVGNRLHNLQISFLDLAISKGGFIATSIPYSNKLQLLNYTGKEIKAFTILKRDDEDTHLAFLTDTSIIIANDHSIEMVQLNSID
ncbi:MAP/microtubule affinity-regulating kinase 3-like [Anneissia japonica]|uniref:MAP/microtubule affinity-regulating kinase 3-like n=1 Tax=Anneissia japonica TaxID=1529436 RepID=UPI001425A28A|nr:MAP/microtubule affinity-regulating kinase 3-like [Anneissia japonica]